VKPLRKWLSRALLALIVLLVFGWTCAAASQWLLRYRAQKLLADIHALEVNRTTTAEAEKLLSHWAHLGEVETGCHDGVCSHGVFSRNISPQIIQSPYTEKSLVWATSKLSDALGLRTATVSAYFTTESGVVTSKGFTEAVGLPYSDWYLRQGAYVPELIISSDESSVPRWLAEPDPLHPNRGARFRKGPYWPVIQFSPKESASVKADLMDFHFSCMTSFFSCHNENEILPATRTYFAKELHLD